MRIDQQPFSRVGPEVSAYFRQAKPTFHDASARLDTLRGFACLLLVIFHAVAEVHLRDPGSLTRLTSVNMFLTPLRMPLFTFLSGYLYAIRPVDALSRRYFLKRKAERLLIPLVFITVLTVIAHALAGSGSVAAIVPTIFSEFGRPSFHLWYIEALFLIFLALGLGASRLLQSVAGCVVLLLAVSLADAVGATDVRLFSIGPAIGLLPYFTAGVLTRYWFAKRSITRHDRQLALAAIVLIIGLRLLQMSGADVPVYRTALAGVLSVFIIMPAIPLVASLGRHSMAIFLYHGLFLAAVTRHLPGPPLVVLVQLVAITLAGPVLLYLATERFAPRALPLFGGAIRRPGTFRPIQEQPVRSIA